jgi:hypothetical protein
MSDLKQASTSWGEMSLEEVAPAAARQLRGALLEALGAVGFSASKPLHFSRELGVDKSLGWKVARFITEEDEIAAIRHLPGKPGLKIVVERLHASRVPTVLVDRVSGAIDELDQMIVRHAGDRDSFDLMLQSLSPSVAREKHESFRRQAFAGNSAIWGVQARLQMAIHVVAPGKTDDALSLALSAGLVDFRRLRPDARWAIARRWRTSDDGGTVRSTHQPIDPRAPKDGPPILTDFSTNPLPPLAAREEPDRPVTRYEIDAGPIGNSGACTCLTGWSNLESASRYRSASDQVGEHFVTLSTPVEVLYLELWVHKSLSFAMQPKLSVYSQLPGGAIYPRDGKQAGRIEIPAEVTQIGDDLNTEDYPRHKELVQTTLRAVGGQIGDFVGFRVRMPYPPIPTVAVLGYELPSR